MGLERLYRRHYRLVRWVARARGIPEAALDDVVHDVFLAIHRRLPERDDRVPLVRWVVGVASNVAFSHRRSQARQSQRLRGLAPAQPPLSPVEELERRDAWRKLSAFLERLGTEQREVFILCDLLGMSVPEVAKTRDVGVNTLYSRLRLARERFNAELAAEGPEFLADAGRQEQPSAEHRRGAWALLAAEIAPLPAVTTAVGWKLALGGLGAAGVIAAAGFAGAGEPDPPPSVAAASPPAAEADRATPTRTGSPPPRVGEPVAVERPVVVERPVIEEPAKAAPSAVRPPPRSADPPEWPRSPEDDLAGEVALLRTAKQALAAGDPTAALAAIDRYAARYAEGKLANERWGLELRAACAARDDGRVRTAATRAPAADPNKPCSGR